MSHYARTPRMVPQPTPVVFPPTHTPYYNHTPNGLGRRQSLGAYIPSQHVYHVTSSEPTHSRSHHRSSSKSRTHRRSRSVDRHGSGRHRRHHHRSSTPAPVRYSSDAHYATPSRHRHSSAGPANYHHSSSSREPHRFGHHGHHGPQYVTHHRESIGDRIRRWFGFGIHRGPVRYVDHRRPMYAV